MALDEYSAAVLGDNPVAYWQLGTGADELADLSGRNHSLTRTGTVPQGLFLIPGHPSRDLPGSVAAYYEAADHADFDTLGTSSYSIEAWANFDTIDAQFRRIIQHNDLTNGWLLVIHAGGPNLYASRQAAGVETLSNFSAPVVGKTYHVVGTYDGANQRLYVNGALADGPNASAGSMGDVAATVRTGFGGGSDYVDGRVSDIAVYSTALSSTQVSAHYSAGLSPGGPGDDAAMGFSGRGAGW